MGKPRLPATARQILETPIPPYPDSHDSEDHGVWRLKINDYRHAQRERARIEDEVAYARVLARRGNLPEAEWLEDHEDPRLVAWRAVLIGIVVDGFLHFSMMSPDRFTTDSAEVFETVAEMWEACELLAKTEGHEIPRPAPRVLEK